MIKQFNYYDSDHEIYNRDIREKIPEKIIDFHVHLWKNQFISDELDPLKINTDPFFSFDMIDEFSLQDFKKVSKTLFPEKQYNGLYFGAPFKEIDIDNNNQIIIEYALKDGVEGLFMPKASHNKDFVGNKILEKEAF
jgi:hypothetical protein